jgi:hypothetical protein
VNEKQVTLKQGRLKIIKSSWQRRTNSCTGMVAFILAVVFGVIFGKGSN